METRNAREASVRDRRGGALITVIVLLTSLLVLTFAISRATLENQDHALASYDDQRSFALAEAGLHEAYEALREEASGNVGSIAEPALLGGGVFWVEATPLGNDRTRLVSTALVGEGRQALEAVVLVENPEPPLFVSTLNSKEDLTLNESVMIDSFDSGAGTYASQAVNTLNGYTYANPDGDARSNEDVILNANATVFGDAIPGPGFNVEFNTGSYVDGSIVAAPEPFVFPDIEFPVFPPLGPYSVPTNGSATLAPGNYDFSTLTINKSGTLTIQGPATLVVDSFTGGKDAGLRIDATNGPVTVYVEGAYVHTAGFKATPVGSSPMAVAFLVGGTQDVTFPANTEVQGGYYAPNADILFANGNECWGAFAANRISMSNDMRFHFDEALLEYWSGETGQDGDALEVLTWREVVVAPAELLMDRRDPMLVLDLDRSLLPTPAEAWQP